MNNKTKAIIVTLFLTFGFTNVFAGVAGGGHSHIASQKKVEKNAKKALQKYVIDGKLVKSWINAKRVESKKIGKEWEIVFINSQIEEKSKQKLGFFMTSYGKFKGATYRK